MFTEKFNRYRKHLSGVSITLDDISNGVLSKRGTCQLEMLYRTLREFIEGAYIIDVDGHIYGSDGAVKYFNVKDLGRSYYEAIFNEQKDFFVSSPFVSIVTQKQIIVMAHKIDHSLAVVTSVYISSLLDFLAPKSDMFLWAEDGVILSSPYPDLLGKNIHTERPLYNKFNENSPELNYRAVVDGKMVDFTGFWSKVHVTGWEVVTFVRDEQIEKGASEQLVISLGIALVSLIIALSTLFYDVV